MKVRTNAILLAIAAVFFVPLAAFAGSCSFDAKNETLAVTTVGVDDDVDKIIIKVAIGAIIALIGFFVVWSIAYERGYSAGWRTAHDARKPFALKIDRNEAP